MPDPFGGVAQLGEHLPCKQGVMSSNLTISTVAMKRTAERAASMDERACANESMFADRRVLEECP